MNEPDCQTMFVERMAWRPWARQRWLVTVIVYDDYRAYGAARWKREAWALAEMMRRALVREWEHAQPGGEFLARGSR